jgi:hypothetical protein
MDRLSTTEADNIKIRLVARLGLPYTKIRNSFYARVGEKLANVKITIPRPSGRYWFNLQAEADSYIWICYSPDLGDIDTYYWIPSDHMRRLIKTSSYRDRTWERRGRLIPNFVIDPKSDSYVAPGYSESISQFKNLTRCP